MSGGYAALEVGVGHLKNVRELVDDPLLGITQDDLDDAELQAKAEIDSSLAALYDISGWTAEPPSLIVQIAQHIGSGVVLEMKFSRDGNGPSKAAEAMVEEGRKLLRRVAAFDLKLVDDSGNVIPRRTTPGIVIANPPRFPELPRRGPRPERGIL
jgi:hypothetical protein